MLRKIILAGLTTWLCLQNVAVANQMSFEQEFAGEVSEVGGQPLQEWDSAAHFNQLSSLYERANTSDPSGSCNVFCGYERTNGYIAFDVSTLGFVVDSATLQLNVSHRSALGPPTYSALKVYSADTQILQDLQVLPAGDISNSTAKDLANRLESGPLGNLTYFIDIPQSGLFDITLSSAAISEINSSTGLTGFGLRLGTAGLARFNLGPSSRLILSGPSASVPTSTTLTLMLLGVILLYQRRAAKA